MMNADWTHQSTCFFFFFFWIFSVFVVSKWYLVYLIHSLCCVFFYFCFFLLVGISSRVLWQSLWKWVSFFPKKYVLSMYCATRLHSFSWVIDNCWLFSFWFFPSFLVCLCCIFLCVKICEIRIFWLITVLSFIFVFVYQTQQLIDIF